MEKPRGPPHACGYGVGADEFVWILGQLGSVAVWANNGAQQRGNRAIKPPPRNTQPDFAPTGRFRTLLARLECMVQYLQDWTNAMSTLLCMAALKAMLRVVTINHACPCCRCGSRNGSQVDKLTSVHWSLTNMIVQLHGLRQEKQSRHQAISKFLNEQRISSVLSVRVRRHVDRSVPQQVRESNADAIRKACTELIVDLLEEMRMPALSAHPFFITLRTKHPHLVNELCHEALQPLLKSPGPDDVVFSAGEPCSRMYVIVNGHAQYGATVQDRAPANGGVQQVRRSLHGGKWLSEAALWTGWTHCGELRVVTDCLLFALDASGFARVISSHKMAHSYAAAYARKFVEGLNKGLRTDLVDAGPVES